MDEVTWGYTRMGNRRHRLLVVEPSKKPLVCCQPGHSFHGRCCLIGDALCGLVLENEIDESQLQYWVPCYRCERINQS